MEIIILAGLAWFVFGFLIPRLSVKQPTTAKWICLNCGSEDVEAGRTPDINFTYGSKVECNDCGWCYPFDQDAKRWWKMVDGQRVYGKYGIGRSE